MEESSTTVKPEQGNANKKKKKWNYLKGLVLLIEIHGMFCVTLSYLLAWQDKMNVVEGVSSTIVTEIIAPILIYGVSKTVENIFEKNKLSGSTPISYLQETDGDI